MFEYPETLIIMQNCVCEIVVKLVAAKVIRQHMFFFH